MREVVSLQCGNRANYLATHFWNVQESYFTYPTPTNTTPEPSPVDHDIHFRPGIGADGTDTYTPRTLIYDFQANFGGLRKLNALYETLEPNQVVRGLWDGTQQAQILPPVEPINYQVSLEAGLPTPQLYSKDVRYWSDFNRLFYHPRSVQPISPQSFSSSLNATESWSNGVELFKDIDREYDLLDHDIRPFLEESDSLSTFQIFSSVDDSWGGYTSRLIETLREEYGKKSIWVWAVEDGRTRVGRAIRNQRLANSAQSMRTIAQYSSAYVRLSAPPSSSPGYIHIEADSDWSTSALLCAAFESVTLPARLRARGETTTTSLDSFEDMLNTNGSQNIWTLKAQSGSRSSNGTASNGVDMFGSSDNSYHHSVHSILQARDSRVSQVSPSSPHNRPNTREVIDGNLEPSHFDIDFSPALPAVPTALPSLAAHQSRTQDGHVFAQIESHRTLLSSSPPSPFKHTEHILNHPHHAFSDPFATSSATTTTTTTILSSHQISLPFPLLTSYPSTLFSFPSFSSTDTAPDRELIVLSAALSTSSSTRRHLLTLRDLVTGRSGGGVSVRNGLVSQYNGMVGDDAGDEVEEVYDDLSRLAAAYEFGWEGSGSDDDDTDAGDGG